MPLQLTTLESAELIAERADERLDTARLEPYLRTHLEGAEGRLAVRQFAGGKANLTYLLRFGAKEFVLRRPPLGPIPPGAHDMRREHRVLSVLHRLYQFAPQSLLLCEDESIIGAVFIVEERRRGFVIRDDIPAEFAGRPELNRRLGFALVDGLGRVEGYLERQLSGWTRRWEASLGGPQEAASRTGMAPVLDWLARNLPRERTGALLHNDYRLDNLLL